MPLAPDNGRDVARDLAVAAPRRLALAAHLGVILCGSLLAFAPPASGAMLVAPLVPGDAGASVAWAIGAGALFVGPGPYRGSIIVIGSRASLLGPALAHGALLLNSSGVGCGAPIKDQPDARA